jgi:hypothetical protein
MVTHCLLGKALAPLLQCPCLDVDRLVLTGKGCRLPEVGMVREEEEDILLEVATLHAADMGHEDLRRKVTVEEVTRVEEEEAIHLQALWAQLVER